MDTEKKLESQVQAISELAKENKNVDAAALMLNALQVSEKNMVSARAKKWAYIVSIGAPPLGLLFALRYYFGTKDDAKQVALTCVALTVVAVGLLFLFTKMFLASSGVSLEEIEGIHPADVIELTQ
jgi:hypothetical protein